MTQRPFLVEPLEEAFAELVGADHDGARGCSLDDPGEETWSRRGGVRGQGYRFT
jgi:hypothetical protein